MPRSTLKRCFRRLHDGRPPSREFASQRTLWLLEELGLDCRVERYRRDPQTMLVPPQLRRLHPVGKSPILVDDGLTVAESGAIIEYLLDHYDAKHPLAHCARPLERRSECASHTYWLHYAEGSAMPHFHMARDVRFIANSVNTGSHREPVAVN